VVVRFLRVLEKAASLNFQVFFATMENGFSFGARARNNSDALKPSLEDLMSLSLANIAGKISEEILYGKASTALVAKSD